MNKHFTTQQNIKDNQNTLYLNKIRVFASLFVVVLHVCGGFYYDYPVTSLAWIIPTFFNALVRTAVPLFVMVGGAIYLNEDKQISIKKLFLTILRFIVIFFLWDFIYLFIDYGVIKNFSNITMVFSSLLNYKYHLWYLLDYIILIAFVPVLRLICKRENRKQVKYLIIIFLICTCCMALINDFIGKLDQSFLFVKILKNISSVINLVNFGKTFNFFILFISGWYLSTFDFTHRLKQINITKWIVGLIAPALTIILCIFVNKNMFDLICSYYYLPNYIIATCIFLTFKHSKCTNTKNQFIDYIGKVSFGIYLVHALVLDIISKHLFPVLSPYFNSFWMILIVVLCAVFVFAISTIISAVLNLFPNKIKKWIC